MSVEEARKPIDESIAAACHEFCGHTCEHGRQVGRLILEVQAEMPCSRIEWSPSDDGGWDCPIGAGLTCDEGYGPSEYCISCAARAELAQGKVRVVGPEGVPAADMLTASVPLKSEVRA